MNIKKIIKGVIACMCYVTTYGQELPLSLQHGLVGHWSMDEGNGTQISDSSPSNVNGVLTEVSWGPGKYKSAAHFVSTSNGYIDLGKKLSDKLNGASQITLSCWVKNTDHPDLRYDIFNTFNGAGAGFCVYLAPKGELRIGGRSTSTESYKSNGFNYTFSGIWVHLVAMIDYTNKEFVLYVNGKKMGVKVGKQPDFTGNNYVTEKQYTNDFIGGFKGRNFSFNGGVDEVRLYRRKLSGSEIYALARPDLNPDLVSPQDLERKKVNTIKTLMKNNVGLYAGKNHAIADDKRYFIDDHNDLVSPFVEKELFYVPISFVAKRFNAEVNWDQKMGALKIKSKQRNVMMKSGDSYLMLNNQKKMISGTLLVRHDVLFAPVDAVSLVLDKKSYQGLSGKLVVFGDHLDSFKKETAKESLAIMSDYFLPDHYPAPKRNVRQTRQELLYLDPAQKKYVSNPSIERLADGTLIASCTNSGTGLVNYIYISEDGAKSWRLQTTLSGIMWATLFQHNGALYLIGTNNSLGDIIIRKSMDKGLSWTKALDSKTGILFKGGTKPYDRPPNHHTAPTPVLKANGRIYRAFEDNDPHEFPKMKAFLISAPENGDLLNAESWAATEKLSYDYKNWKEPYRFLAPGWLEGNAVQAPDGNVWNFIRFNSRPYSDKAAVMRLSPDGKSLMFNYPNDIIDFPGGNTKFSIKYDNRTKRYYSLVNNSVDTTFAGHRCVLSLVSSKDLLHWDIVETVLYDDNLNIWDDTLLQVGYQYVDFVFSEKDIVFVVRESWGGSANFHDANRFTSYVLEDYAKFIK
ncbi:MAG: LamG-like jellyroll fold domain-containing protein [Pedobacter sp.]|uniref:LamG-like jellyroll fold domain-containing protein n=1 Tax=Pedobacter sp. TaxID=1411316 RepID=UPI00356AC86F